MAKTKLKQRQTKILKIFRKTHRAMGATLFIFFLFLSISGILLGWKKHSGELIFPKTYIGTSTDLKNWLPLDSLHKRACEILQDSVSPTLSLELERIDVRKDQGMVKFIFEDHYWEVQLDGATSNLLQLERRRSDFIENIHDASILDRYLGTTQEQIKLIYTSIMGLSLLTFTITGFWLWFGPKKMKKREKKSSDNPGSKSSTMKRRIN